MTDNSLWLLYDVCRARRQGLPALERRQRSRLAELVAFARAHSPAYRALYQRLPDRVEDPTLLPVTNKQQLMARFDDWVTDPAVTFANVRAFADDPSRVGERFLGRYTVATTSGTTGTRGIFVLDNQSLAVIAAVAVRMLSAWLTLGDLLRIIAGGGRLALVMASGGHFASAVAAARLRMGGQWRRATVRVFPVHMPLPQIVDRLNRFRPVIVASYAGMAALLAGEQQAGRLHIKPVLLALSAEGLRLSEYGRIARAFHATVGNFYAATECPFFGYSCAQGWLHVNSDWVVCEPVDTDYRPVPPGEQSHTVLVSNLANRVQPILRYDLGDRILQRPDPCPCGNPLPAIRVRGRAADMLTFPTEGGEPVTITPMAFDMVVERIPGIELFQLVQTTPQSIRVRLRPAASTDPDRVWQAVQSALTRLLAAHGLDHITVERAVEPPVQSAGGKYRTIVPLGRDQHEQMQRDPRSAR